MDIEYIGVLLIITLTAVLYYFARNWSQARRARLRVQDLMKVVDDFADHVHHFPTTFTKISDASYLPHPKEEIREALMLEIMAHQLSKESDSNRKSALANLLVGQLPQYQKGVGPEPLYLLGVDLLDVCQKLFEHDSLKSDQHLWEASVSRKIKEFAAQVESQRPNAERYKLMELAVGAERASYCAFLEKIDPPSTKLRERQSVDTEVAVSADKVLRRTGSACQSLTTDQIAEVESIALDRR